MILPKQPLECIDFQGFIDSVSVDEPLIWSQRQARQSRFYPRPANSSVLPSFLSFLILFILLFSASKCSCVQAAFCLCPTRYRRGGFPACVFIVMPGKTGTHSLGCRHQRCLPQMGVSHGGSGIAVPQQLLHLIERVPGID